MNRQRGISRPGYAPPSDFAGRLANTPYTSPAQLHIALKPVASVSATLVAHPAMALPVLSSTRLDMVGHLAQPIPASEPAQWTRELTTHPQALRVATLHLWLGEWQLGANEQPQNANRHFAQAKYWARQAALLPATATQAKISYGIAAFDMGYSFFYEGDYDDAAQTFHSLLRSRQIGYDRRLCAMWDRHAAACAGYHQQRSAAGIPEPPRLDP